MFEKMFKRGFKRRFTRGSKDILKRWTVNGGQLVGGSK